jgi:Methyltransferase domain
MRSSEEMLRECVFPSGGRHDLWIRFLNAHAAARVAEIGVYRGDFAAQILGRCRAIEKYYMIDPWRHLSDWNKPANTSDLEFERFLSEAMSKTDFAKGKRVILRGKTTQVLSQIPDGSLDFAYIDGDHTLRGITLDLISIFPKIRVGGWIGGDDFTTSIWQHRGTFEPTLVFPFAVYFAEAVGVRIYGLPHAQFLMEKNDGESFVFIDLAGSYSDISMKGKFSATRLVKLSLKDWFPHLASAAEAFGRLRRRWGGVRQPDCGAPCSSLGGRKE